MNSVFEPVEQNSRCRQAVKYSVCLPAGRIHSPAAGFPRQRTKVAVISVDTAGREVLTRPERNLRTMAITVPVTFPVATMSRPVERTGKLHLLVVDEDAAIRSACCEIATDLGFVPQTVSSIEAARTLLRDQGIDILLLDLRAPLEEGLGLLTRDQGAQSWPGGGGHDRIRDRARGGRGDAHRGRRLSDQTFRHG